MPTLAPAEALQNLRHELAAGGYSLPNGFHAKNDPKPRRLRAFEVISRLDLQIYAVALEKRKAYPNIRSDVAYMYKLGCHFLLRYLFEQVIPERQALQIIISNYGSGEINRTVEAACRAVIKQNGTKHTITTAFWGGQSHCGLQLADYCAWGIQRHYEAPDDEHGKRIMEQLKPKIANIFEPFRLSTQKYY